MIQVSGAELQGGTFPHGPSVKISFEYKDFKMQETVRVSATLRTTAKNRRTIRAAWHQELSKSITTAAKVFQLLSGDPLLEKDSMNIISTEDLVRLMVLVGYAIDMEEKEE